MYSVYEARSELDALLPEIKSALAFLDEGGIPVSVKMFIADLPLIVRLETLKSTTYDVTSLVRICKEISSSYAHRNVLAVILLCGLAGVAVPAIRAALGVSKPYATNIRAGRCLPHPRHWVKLANLAGITCS